MVADGRLEVCDGTHRIVVMKEAKGRGPRRTETWVPTDRPFSSVDKCVSYVDRCVYRVYYGT